VAKSLASRGLAMASSKWSVEAEVGGGERIAHQQGHIAFWIQQTFSAGSEFLLAGIGAQQA